MSEHEQLWPTAVASVKTARAHAESSGALARPSLGHGRGTGLV